MSNALLSAVFLKNNLKKLKKLLKKVLTKGKECDIITKSSRGDCGSIAQLGEHLPYKQRVIGSSPIVPTIFMAR